MGAKTRATFTPGPWKVYVDEDGRQTVEQNAAYLSNGAYCVIVCDIRPSGLTREPSNANARLIAAAPALYEALRAMAARFRIHDGVDAKDAEDYARVWNEALDALALVES